MPVTTSKDKPAPLQKGDGENNICVRKCDTDNGYFAEGGVCKKVSVKFQCGTAPENAVRVSDTKSFVYQKKPNGKFEYNASSSSATPQINIGTNGTQVGMKYDPLGTPNTAAVSDTNPLTPPDGICPWKCKAKNMKKNTAGTACEEVCPAGSEYIEGSIPPS